MFNTRVLGSNEPVPLHEPGFLSFWVTLVLPDEGFQPYEIRFPGRKKSAIHLSNRPITALELHLQEIRVTALILCRVTSWERSYFRYDSVTNYKSASKENHPCCGATQNDVIGCRGVHHVVVNVDPSAFSVWSDAGRNLYHPNGANARQIRQSDWKSLSYLTLHT